MNSKYPLHPDFAHIKDSKKNPESKLLLRVGNMLIRSQANKVKTDGNEVVEERRMIPGYEGAQIKIRVYSPVGVKEPLPCVVNFHGGAFVGDLMAHQIGYCLTFAKEVPCKVVAVEYRLALDYPFPYGVEDCYAGLQWVIQNAGILGIDPKRVSVFGDSAGGALAAAVCLMARDRKGLQPAFQMLIYPVTDSSCSSESARKYLDSPEFNGYGNIYMWKLYLANGDRGMPQYAAPLLAEDLSGLPPAYVESAEFDPLHDEGIAYARKLEAAGVPVELNETKGTYHGFDIQAELPYSKAMLKKRTEVLKKVFYGEQTSY